MSRPPKPRLIFLVGCLVAAGLVVGLGYASIPDSGGVIHGCYDKGGALRVIDDATESCTTKETPLNWNQTGPQGPPGQPATVKRTRLHYTDVDTLVITPATNATWQQLRTIGSFNKDVAATSIKVTWVGHVWQTGGAVCNFQLRIDGKSDSGNSSNSFTLADGGIAVINEESGYSPVAVTTIFNGLSTGSHEVTIWTRGVISGTDPLECWSNPGNYGQDVFVEEEN